MNKPILLEVVAPILERIGLCISCGAVLETVGMERAYDSYPEEWRLDFENTMALVKRAMDLGGQGLAVRWSDPRSLRGLYLSLRHALRRYPAFVLSTGEKFVGLEEAASGLLPLLGRA
jgi:hypothetical protein